MLQEYLDLSGYWPADLDGRVYSASTGSSMTAVDVAATTPTTDSSALHAAACQCRSNTVDSQYASMSTTSTASANSNTDDDNDDSDDVIEFVESHV